MEATATMSIIISVVLGIICIPCGLFLGLIPMKADQVTAKQSKASQMMCFIIALIFIGLLVAGRDLETWGIVIGLVIGFAIGKIPALHTWAVNKWPFLEPKKPATKPKRVKKAKKK
ncbi:hypothetical protein BISA_1946 [Bifidobacterium saguini DSM 23967]|uniref:Uncharacterized protein n=2 Tax=Bifidobacterium saguini TaxID=762210 RepID=A0A087D617_9BIFI|nr:hypothetical protein [Bifidobacterium saguini]KFI90967.1 hypothetical protein BISA_1946 [Bifidobacterium saguini DSM 23967]QTB91456.1 hypothetical protein BSD967_03280 [Bifidobacterium saguini]